MAALCVDVPANYSRKETKVKEAMRTLLMRSPLADLSVSIRSGPARGMKWTLFPFSRLISNVMNAIM